jgi:hypothetical protein
MAGAEDFGVEAEAGVVAVAEAAARMIIMIGTGVTILAGIVIAGALTTTTEVDVVAAVAAVAGVVTETDLIPAVLSLVASVRARVRSARH